MEVTASESNEKGPAPVGPIPISVSEADVSDTNQTGKVTLSACTTYIEADRWIQGETSLRPKDLDRLCATIGTPRLARYVELFGSDKRLALRLHFWNAAVAASILPTLQIAEVSVRNFALQRIKAAYGKEWYKEDKLLRKLGGPESHMGSILRRTYLEEVQKKGEGSNLSNFVTSELPFGFWVNAFTTKFKNELWKRPLHTYLTNLPRGATLTTLHAGVDDVRKFRNNVAHHKNLIYMKPTVENFERSLDVLSWFCKSSSVAARETSSFKNVWAGCPVDISSLVEQPTAE
jgi:hypothetical protein